MQAQDIKEGDILRDPDSAAVVYRVIRDASLYAASNEDDVVVEVYVRHEVDGGTDIRFFDINQEVPLERP